MRHLLAHSLRLSPHVLLVILCWSPTAYAQVVRLHEGTIRIHSTLTVDAAQTVRLDGTWTCLNGATPTLGLDVLIVAASGAVNCPTLGLTVRHTGDQFLNLRDARTLRSLTLDKPLGTLRLNHPLTLTESLNLTRGVLDLNGQAIDLGTTGTLTEHGNHRVTGPGSLSAARMLNQPNAVSIGGLGVTVTSSANFGPTTVTRGHTTSTHQGKTTVARYYDIQPTTSSEASKTLTLSYAEAELGGHPEGDLTLLYSPDTGQMWQPADATATPNSNVVTLVTTAPLGGRWTFASRSSLPVELTTFTAQTTEDTFLLIWTTASETNNAGFEIQTSMPTAPKTWQTVTFVEGQGSTAMPYTYRHTYAPPTPGIYRFRLKQVDVDGAFIYSDTQEALLTLTNAFFLTEGYPNPFRHRVTFIMAVPYTQPVEAIVYDLTGKRLAHIWDNLLDANTPQQLVWHATNLPSGLYVVQFLGDTWQTTRLITHLR